MKIVLNSWQDVANWTDEHLSVSPSYLDKVNKRKYPIDAFSLGQLSSKAWMLDHLAQQMLTFGSPITVGILGCWIGSTVPFILRHSNVQRVYGFDLDPASIDLAEQFNYEHVVNNWRFKGVVADVSQLNCSDMEFQTGGELITVTPNVIINTSCEHMNEDWFHSCNSEQLIVMQTNDSPDFDGHVNTCESEFEMWDKYPLSDRLFSGVLVTPAYTRFMQIGYK